MLLLETFCHFFQKRSFSRVAFEFLKEHRDTRSRLKWLPEESERLVNLVHLYGRQWNQLSTFFPGRHPITLFSHYKLCMGITQTLTPSGKKLIRSIQEEPEDWKKWRKQMGLTQNTNIIKDYYLRHCDSNIKSGRWTKEEVERLHEAVGKNATSRGVGRFRVDWLAVSKEVKCRTEHQCLLKWNYQKHILLGIYMIFFSLSL